MSSKSRKRQLVTKKEVKQMILSNIETKSFPVYDSTTASYSGTFTHLSNIVVGGSLSQRIGTKVEPVKVVINMNCISTSSDNYNTMRVVVFRWYDLSSTAPVYSDIFDNTAGNGYQVVMPYNRYTQGRYHIMYDKAFVLADTRTFTSGGTAVNDSSKKDVKHLNIRIKGRKIGRKYIEYDSAGNSEGGIYLAVFTDSVPATTHPAYEYAGQVLYKDA